MSNMVVRTNVFALNSHRNLTNVGIQQRTSAQRLSSGFRVNSAADDAAGLAISETMRAQIRGMDQAAINAQDGAGLIQTAEGAMATISDMVIRVRELMVQAANDTNTLNNREAIQLEIDQIMTEINDVTFRTQFNTRTLLAGGLGGEGGGPSSPVSLAWMVFDQARVLGLGQPGGIVTRVPVQHARNDVDGRLPNVHYNPNNRNSTSVRSEIIGLQNDLNDLARRVAERMKQDPNVNFTPDDLSAMFEDPRNLNFGDLNMIPAERTELQSIASRMESALRVALRASEEMFQITQDQINALGGMGAVNFDGSNVFSGLAVSDWVEASRDLLQDARDGFQLALDTVSNAMAFGTTFAIEAMNQAIQDVVGVIGGEVEVHFVDDGVVPGTHIADPANPGEFIVAPPATHIRDAATGDFIPTPPGETGTHIAGPTPGTFVLAPIATHVEDPDNAGSFILASPGTHVADDAAPGGFRLARPGEPGTHLRITTPVVREILDGETGTHIADDDAPGGFRPILEGEVGTHIALANRPTNNILSYMERLLDLSKDVLGNVNLESNAMWFQIGPNALQGTVLRLEGIHTGILGGGRGDLAMLIDVRERSGIPISEQLEFIDIAEGIVNNQRARLGAVQNRLEYTRQSLAISSENLSAAESRIRDTDMAREMMRFTQAQVLQQAGISMLAQANQLPASILQLLQ